MVRSVDILIRPIPLALSWLCFDNLHLKPGILLVDRSIGNRHKCFKAADFNPDCALNNFKLELTAFRELSL